MFSFRDSLIRWFTDSVIHSLSPEAEIRTSLKMKSEMEEYLKYNIKEDKCVHDLNYIH